MIVNIPSFKFISHHFIISLILLYFFTFLNYKQMQPSFCFAPTQTWIQRPANSFQKTFNPRQLSIIEQINRLINAINCKETQLQLQGLYENSPQQFFQCIFTIVGKCINNFQNVSQSNKQIHCMLLYVRHFINMQTHRMPDITKKFTNIYPAISNKNLRDLLVDCFRVYLAKPHNTIHTKQYLHEVAFQLLQQIQNNAVTQSFLAMIVQTLENLTQSKDYRPGLAIQAETMIKSIISMYSTKKPQQINTDLWVWTIITLCNYTKFVPSVQFMQKLLINPGYSPKFYGKVFIIVNKMHHLFGSVEQIYYILQVQLKRLSDRTFIQDLQEQHGVEGLQSFVRAIIYLIKDSFSLITQTKTTDINQFMLFHYFKEYNLFETSLLGILQIIKQHNNEHSQLFYLLTQLLQQFSQFLEQDQMIKHVSTIKDKIQSQYMYCLLSGLPRNCLEIFGASNMLKQNILYILCNTHTINISDRNTLATMHIFLQFALHYLDVYHYLQDQDIGVGIYKLVNEFIAHLPQTTQQGNRSKNQIQQILKIKCYGMCLLFRMEKYNPNPDHTKISVFLQMVYELIQKVMKNQGRYQPQIISLCIDGLSYLKFVQLYKETLCQCLINFFTVKLGAEQNSDNRVNQQYVYLQFLKILHDCYDLQIKEQNKSLVCLLGILKFFIYSNNKSLQDQACQFILKILFALNSFSAKKKVTEENISWVLRNIYETGVYSYIQQSFLKEDEDFIFCKILMETLIHETGSKLVKDILTKACSSPQSYKISHNFDKIWQALVILYGERNQYTEKKGINSRIDKIMGGSLQALLMNLSIDQKNQYNRKSKKQGKRKINWCWLPEVRKILQAGSYVGYCIQHKLNNESND